MVLTEEMYSRSNSVKRVSWRDSDDISSFVEENEKADMTCGVAGIVRSASFRRSKKEPYWITSKSYLFVNFLSMQRLMSYNHPHFVIEMIARSVRTAHT